MKNRINIIVVDGDPTFLKMWEKVFGILDRCRLYLTSDPEAAREIAKKHPIDLLISEIIMEKGNGFQLAEEIHKTNPKAQIILTTAYNCDLRRFELNKPQFHILYKPYQKMEDVIKFVEDILIHKDPREDTDEDSWSENEDYPAVMEWKL